MWSTLRVSSSNHMARLPKHILSAISPTVFLNVFSQGRKDAVVKDKMTSIIFNINSKPFLPGRIKNNVKFKQFICKAYFDCYFSQNNLILFLAATQSCDWVLAINHWFGMIYFCRGGSSPP